jgi:hypothetical protein
LWRFVQFWVAGYYRDKKVVGVFVCVFSCAFIDTDGSRTPPLAFRTLFIYYQTYPEMIQDLYLTLLSPSSLNVIVDERINYGTYTLQTRNKYD